MRKKDYPTIGIVIPTYNAAKFITPCLQSIENNSYPSSICIVVDNASTDNTVLRAKQSIKNIIIVKNKHNIGFAPACNKGISLLLNRKCQYILLLNPDTIVDHTLLHELSTQQEKNKSIAINSPIITYMDHPKRIWYAGGIFHRWLCITKHRYMNSNVSTKLFTSGPTDFATGACLMIRSSAIKDIGYLPEEYFLYFEDVFYSRKAIEKGYLCYLLAKPLVRHAVSSSTGHSGTNDFSQLKAYYFARNPLLFIHSNVQGLRKITNYIAQFCIALPYYSIQMGRQKNFKSLLSYIHGIYDGMKGI